MQTIKAVIFDYGNVIAQVDHGIFLRRIAQRSSLSVDDLKNLSQHHQDLLVAYESGMVSSETFGMTIIDRCKLSMSLTELRDAFIDIFQRIEPTIALIKSLKPHYKIGLLSNTNEWHYKAEIETVEAFQYFDTVTVSFEVGTMKPFPEIYTDALTKLQVQPGEIVYIDDIAAYVEGAQRLGLNAIHYTSHDSLMKDLRNMGVGV